MGWGSRYCSITDLAPLLDEDKDEKNSRSQTWVGTPTMFGMDILT